MVQVISSIKEFNSFLYLLFSEQSSSRKGIRQFRLAAVTKSLNHSQIDNMTIEAVRRILVVESE